MFKVLIFAYYFPPKGLSGVQRTTKFVKYLPGLNWAPTVITTGDIAYFAHDNSLLNDLKNENIRVIRVSGKEINSILKKKGTMQMPREIFRKMYAYLSAWLNITDNKRSWARKAYKEAQKLCSEEKFDVIFVSGPPFTSFSAAIRISEEFKIPVFVDYRDLWYGNQFAIYPTLWHKIKVKQEEYRALHRVDKIVVTNRRIKERMMKTYPFLTHDKMLIIPHGFDPQDIAVAQPEAKKLTKKMVITYSGIFYEFITPKYFLRAFRQILKENPEVAVNIELHFIGFLRIENRKLIKKYNLQNFVVEHSYMEHLEALKKVIASDLLWFMVGKGRNADTISSSKMYEYFGTKKPILACLPDGALKDHLKKYEAAYLSDPYDVKTIKENILKAYSDFENNKQPIPDEDFVAKFDRTLLTKQLATEFQFFIKVR
ncbi:MAG: glycosyltransferase [Ignavibacteriales bacterium]|nr:MAG: glycosyltransferase family 4 protein [Ignavibacteriaceae bacterium]MBW7872248.1 glycosyltransferase [Ignavibacteria bacterium]MCZ2144060.1 glycosyltransferase [Ignavibacteriales bacterium]OQY79237.1 MAG: glycosyl transferase family 1 [Ignavibacteriales bacterium UTCHB3]MBV6445605.1 hypothetical protein [Ignavibacteriaceae bacterium]